MREIRISCKDDKTGYQVLLTETSYNFACDWLDKVVKEAGREICRCFHNDETGLTEIWTAEWSDKICNYKPTRHYFYDESRGYLLGE
jgi:hypothetical protein